MQGQIKLASPSVISDDLTGEAIVMNLETGFYYLFNKAATDIWRSVFEKTVDAQSLVDAVGSENIDFIQLLIDEQLLALNPETAPEAIKVAVLSLGELPSFQRFSDMHELLLLDPVHDVAMNEEGWPVSEPKNNLG